MANFGKLAGLGSKLKGLGNKAGNAGKKAAGKVGSLAKTAGLGLSAFATKINSTIGPILNLVSIPINMARAFADWSWKHKSLIASEVIRLTTEMAVNKATTIENSMPVEQTDPRLQGLKTESEIVTRDLDEAELKDERSEVREAPKIETPKVTEAEIARDAKIAEAAKSLDDLLKLNERLNTLKADQNEAVRSVMMCDGIRGLVKGMFDLGKTCHRILVLQTYVKNYVESISGNQALLAEADRISEEREIKYEEARQQATQEYQDKREELQILRDKENKIRYYQLQNSNKELKDKIAGLAKQDNDAIASLTNFVVELGGWVNIGTQLTKELFSNLNLGDVDGLLKKLGFGDDEKSEEAQEQAEEQGFFGKAVDFLNSLMGGIDFSQMTDKGFFRNLTEGVLNIPRIIKNNVVSAWEFGNQVMGPIGGLLASGIMIPSTITTTTLGMGTSLIKMFKDLAIGISEIPGVGSALSGVLEIFGYESDSRKRDKLRKEADEKFNAFIEARKQYAEGRISASQLLDLGKKIKEIGSKVNDSYATRVDAVFNAMGLDEEKVKAEAQKSDQAYLQALNGNIVNKKEFLEATKGRFGRNLANYNPVQFDPKQVEAEEEIRRRQRDAKFKPKGFEVQDWDPNIVLKNRDVDLNSLRMGPLQSQWIADAYDDAGIPELAVITSAVRDQASQKQLNPNAKNSLHQMGRAIDLRVGWGSPKQQIRNGIAVMRNLFDRMEMEGVDPNLYRGVIHNIVKDGKDQGLHTHLEYLGSDSDGTGDMNVGSHNASQEAAFKKSKSAKRKGNAIEVNYIDAKTGKDEIPWTSFRSPSSEYPEYDPAMTESGDPNQSSIDVEQVVKTQSELISRFNLALSQKLDKVEAEIIGAIAENSTPKEDYSQYITAPRRGI